METGVFERKRRRAQASESIDAVRYNLLIGAVLLWGFGINLVMLQLIPPEFIFRIHPLLFFIGYFASCWYGIGLFTKSTNPWVSFAGYNFVVVPFGLVINAVVSRYDATLVFEALRITGLVTALMMVLGSAFPKFFQRISGALAVALLAVVVVELVEIFIFRIHHDILDWIVAIIFCGYVGYDWGRANNIPKTVDNAVDSAAALYMDIVNLFLRILRILGRRRR